jgi:hypothetical protein
LASQEGLCSVEIVIHGAYMPWAGFEPLIPLSEVQGLAGLGAHENYMHVKMLGMRSCRYPVSHFCPILRTKNLVTYKGGVHSEYTRESSGTERSADDVGCWVSLGFLSFHLFVVPIWIESACWYVSTRNTGQYTLKLHVHLNLHMFVQYMIIWSNTDVRRFYSYSWIALFVKFKYLIDQHIVISLKWICVIAFNLWKLG